jgi:hypothetical protein
MPARSRTPDERAARRAWRLGWRGRVQVRWDLVPVSDLGLDRRVWSKLFLAGLYTAGHVRKAATFGLLRDTAGLGKAGAKAAIEAVRQLRAQVARNILDYRREANRKRKGA